MKRESYNDKVKSFFIDFLLIFSSVFGVFIGLGLSFWGLTQNKSDSAVIGVILLIIGIASSVVLSNRE